MANELYGLSKARCDCPSISGPRNWASAPVTDEDKDIVNKLNVAKEGDEVTICNKAYLVRANGASAFPCHHCDLRRDCLSEWGRRWGYGCRSQYDYRQNYGPVRTRGHIIMELIE